MNNDQKRNHIVPDRSARVRVSAPSLPRPEIVFVEQENFRGKKT